MRDLNIEELSQVYGATGCGCAPPPPSYCGSCGGGYMPPPMGSKAKGSGAHQGSGAHNGSKAVHYAQNGSKAKGSKG